MAALAAAALLLVACSGGDDRTPPPTTSSPSTTASPAGLSVGCQATIDAVRARLAGRAGVSDVGIDAACETVIVATDLPGDATGQSGARLLCDEVTGVVFARPDVPKVAVVGAPLSDGGARRLAEAQRGEQCTTPAQSIR